MPAPNSSQETSNAGITITASGDRIIPASRRADGSERKAIKVRPGYQPPEDAKLYKNRAAEAWKNRGSGGVPGAASVDDEKTDSAAKASSNKNAKRREARKKAKAVGTQEEDEQPISSTANGNVEKSATSDKVVQENWRATAKPDGADAEAEKEKHARNLRKKLRQARELKDKKESGESLLPEQFEKVIRISELIRQLSALGVDPEEPQES
ncbi:hypothetical protein L228DRAFT_268856 [Xylona heveae TC161]|uniref:WIBG Mago-binding domain-containing protein n=1 Tax=Xylona heveae (strain CBS 132557 / TC161) TaxID=1328760 RepID=A0A165GN23_XYLHT|nr:hypothetical protein L228DRAFT_268856 [Xylona heveae TC161]KZF22389.1 hypothetical protein L228DRAFT_268856 [Xylona heveae TC161]